MKKTKVYRDLIDALVEECREGQGQIGPRRARNGVWHLGATEDHLSDQHQINLLLAGLSVGERETLARMLEHSFSGGIFETLKALGPHEIQPFLEGYEGSPYHDFVGRLQDDEWQWPEE